MSVTVDKHGRERIACFVYLADGQECRSIQVSPKATVSDLVTKMLEAKDDWTEDGAISKREPGSESSTDAAIDKYGIVEVRIPPGGGAPTERILPRSLAVSSKEMGAVRREWERIAFRQVQALFTRHNKGRAGEGGMSATAKLAAARKAKQQRRPSVAARLKKAKDEYWFIAPFPSGGATSAKENVRVKLVNTDEYVVVRKKEGWLKVKEKGKTKTRWVVFQENTLMFFKDANSDSPTSSYEGIDTFEINLKPGKKEKVSIELQRGKKEKLALLCENDIMADRWYDAIRQGASGDKSAPAAPRGRKVLKLRMQVADDIPEYTEEEETREELRARSAVRATEFKRMAQAQAAAAKKRKGGRGEYVTIEEMQRIHTETTLAAGGSGSSGGGGGAAAGASSGDEDQGTYLTVEDVNDLMINEEGDYLTLETLEELAQEGGYLRLEEAAEAGYLTLEEAKEMAHEAGYLDVAAAPQLVSSEGTYLTVEDMQELAEQAGYLTIDDMRDLAGLDD